MSCKKGSFKNQKELYERVTHFIMRYKTKNLLCLNIHSKDMCYNGVNIA